MGDELKKQTCAECQNDEATPHWLSILLARFGKPMLWALLVLSAAAFWFHTKSSSSSQQTEQDSFQAALAGQSLERGDGASDEAVAVLRTLVERQPALHARYDALIAQWLLSQHEEAGQYAESALEMQPEIEKSCFGAFARCSLQIADGDYAGALEKARQLKEAMDLGGLQRVEGEGLPNLYLANLLRIASLCQQLDQHQEEVIAWKELETWMAALKEQQGWARNESLLQVFDMGTLTLEDYIAKRKEALAFQFAGG